MSKSNGNFGDHIEEVSVRVGQIPVPIFSVSHEKGFVPSHEQFDKQVYSRDIAAYKVVELGDLAYNPSRINVGSVAVSAQEGRIAVSPMYIVVRCKRSLRPQFLLHFLKSDVGQSEIRHRCEGAVRFQLKFKDLASIPQSIPSIPEQDRVLQLLDATDELRKLRQQSDRRTADLIPAIFDDMFGDPETNPKLWPIYTAGELMISCEYGTSTKADESERGLPIVRMNNVLIDGSLDLTNLKYVSLSQLEIEKYRLKPGDVLFNRTNSRELVGKTGLWDGRFEAVPASYFIRVRLDASKEQPLHFVTYMNLPYMKRQLATIARGAIGQANINAKELKSIRLPVPPIELQQEFAECVRTITKLKEEQAKSGHRVNDLYQSMVHRAFEGEL